MNWAAPAYAWLVLLGLPATLLARRMVLWRRQGLLRVAGNRPGESQSRFATLSMAAIFLLIVIALCRPQWGLEMPPQERRGLDILIALDVSRSMLANDVRPTRLAAAKEAIAGLLRRLQGERIGLIAFAGSAFLVCPLTTDYDTFASVLDETVSDSLPLGGTFLAGALAEARRAFVATEAHRKVLVVISDGEDHGSDVAAGAMTLRGAGITVHSIVAGTAAGGPIQLSGGEFLKNRQGAVVRSRSRPESLQALAKAGGGSQFDLATDPKALERLYAAGLPSQDNQEIPGTRQQLAERFQLPLAMALLLLLIEPFISRRRTT
jgi:Ca-activated chloride channel homolog